MSIIEEPFSLIWIPGKYVLGDIEEVLEGDELVKAKKAIPKSKKKVCEYIDDQEFAFFKLQNKEWVPELIDMIDVASIPCNSGTIILLLAERVTKKRLKNCYRFEIKSEWDMECTMNPEDLVIMCRIPGEPGPVHMFVTPRKTEAERS